MKHFLLALFFLDEADRVSSTKMWKNIAAAALTAGFLLDLWQHGLSSDKMTIYYALLGGSEIATKIIAARAGIAPISPAAPSPNPTGSPAAPATGGPPS